MAEALRRGRVASHLLFGFVLIGALASCAGIPSAPTEYPLHSQSVDASIPEGMARAVFFNGPKGGTESDGSDKVNVFLRGRGLGGIRKWQYIQAMLEPGEYEVRLTHRDIGTFSSGHVLTIEPGENWVNVYSTLTSNRLAVKEGPPERFEERWQPAPTHRLE